MLRKTIRPEFLNRIDDTIVFTPLSKKDIKEVVKLQFEKVVKRLSGNDVKIEITENAIEWLAEMGYDPHFGARPVKRVLQKYLLNELSKKILSGKVQKDVPITIDISENQLVFRN
jgi:ATP-dependent Clp protease ATP-binding subunit ClpB